MKSRKIQLSSSQTADIFSILYNTTSYRFRSSWKPGKGNRKGLVITTMI